MPATWLGLSTQWYLLPSTPILSPFPWLSPSAHQFSALLSPSRPAHQSQGQGQGAGQVAVRPGACLGGEVAQAGRLQTSAVSCPIECVAAVTQALEAARGVDADVVTSPLEGALVDVCGQ